MPSHGLTSWSACVVFACGLASAATPPVVSPTGALVADGGAANDAMGTAMVARDGLLLIGARGDDSIAHNSGAVYCFQLGPDGYQQIQKITPADPNLAEEYGHAVAIDSGRALVGVPLAGGVAVLEFNGTSWVETGALFAGTPGDASDFGDAVAILGDRIAVGSPGSDEQAGRVDLFDLINGEWRLEQSVLPPDATSNDRFGTALALGEDLLVIGSPYEDSAAPDAGAVFIYQPGDKGWELLQTLIAPAAASQEYFGRKLALEDDLLVIGAYRRDEVAIDSGAAFVYRRGAEGFTLEATLSDPASVDGSEFGDAVDISGDRIVIGGPGDQVRGVGAGAMWTFTFTDGAWQAEARIESPTASGYEFLGTSVCLDGEVVLGGAPLASLAASYAGATYLLDLSIDCDGDGRADVLAIANGEVEDCNENGVPDSCDIAAGQEEDQDDNGIPDSCFFDCNGNGVDDAQDILKNPNLDFNQNGVIDSCECFGDILIDGIVDGGDLGQLLIFYNLACGEGTANPDCKGDLNGDGEINGADLGLMLGYWGPCN